MGPVAMVRMSKPDVGGPAAPDVPPLNSDDRSGPVGILEAERNPATAFES
jgi:hypothetical protein